MDVVVYGKIIIDDVRVADGSVVAGLLGGGGPQAVFGARLWGASVGLLSRAGADLSVRHRDALAALGADLSGVVFYPDLPTLGAAVPAPGGAGAPVRQGTAGRWVGSDARPSPAATGELPDRAACSRGDGVHQ